MPVDSGEKMPTPNPELSTHAAHRSDGTKFAHINTEGMVERASICQGLGPV